MSRVELLRPSTMRIQFLKHDPARWDADLTNIADIYHSMYHPHGHATPHHPDSISKLTGSAPTSGQHAFPSHSGSAAPCRPQDGMHVDGDKS